MVGERLSQDGSPVPDERLDQLESPPVPGTPQQDEEEEEEYEQEEEEEDYEEPQFDREQLIERYHVSHSYKYYFCIFASQIL